MKKGIGVFFTGVIFTLILLLLPKIAFASTLSLSPGGGNIAVGGTTSVVVRLNTGGEAVNAVSAFLSYPQDKLDVAWVSGGGAFAIEAEKSYGGGIIKISRGNINPVTGSVTVATIGFKGKALGSATVAFIGGSAAPRASDSSDSLNLGGSRGGVYNVVKAAPVTPKPTASAGQVGGETAPSLQISQITVSSISTNSATIAWKTNIPADSYLEYGLEQGVYFLNASDDNLVTSHNLKIIGPLLQPGNLFHFRIKSQDESENSATSTDQILQLVGYKVRVRVVDEAERVVAGKEIWLYSDPQKRITDSRGEVVFENITEGNHLLVVKSDNNEKTSEIKVNGTTAVLGSGDPPVNIVKIPTSQGKISQVFLLGFGVIVVLVAAVFIFLRKRWNKKVPAVPTTTSNSSSTNVP